MAKKIEENFFTSNVFIFDSYSCHCELTETYSQTQQDNVPAFKIIPDSTHPIKLAFETKVGLVRLNADGTVAEENLLGKLTGIDSVDSLMSFFERNGFFWNIAPGTAESIPIDELIKIKDRLQATLELMSTITDMSRTSYEKIVRMIYYHLFMPKSAIQKTDYSSAIYHPYCSFLDAHKREPREDRLNDTFNNENFSFSDSITDFSMNADLVDSILKGTPNDDRYEHWLFRDIFNTYCTPRIGKDNTMLLINDFLFHYFYEVGIITGVDFDRTDYYGDTVNKSNFTDAMKEHATEIGKLIIKEELEENLKGVHPIYNIDKLEPGWKIDSLLSALYFGLFYMRPKLEGYRRCADPKCNQFFPCSVTSRKKKYCSTACLNRMMIANKRARDRAKESMEE